MNGVNIICEQSSGCNALRDVVAKTTRLDLIKLSHVAESMTSLVLLNNFITSSLSSYVEHDLFQIVVNRTPDLLDWMLKL